jgi:signal transduction histidine kinase
MIEQENNGGLREAQTNAAPAILVVDDDSGIRDVVSFVLSDEGYTVVQAANGEIALSLIRERPPDLILSDAMMPEMDGFDLCRQVRANPDWSHIPFIFLTAKGLRSDIRHGMDLGADDYLPKPFEAEELLSAVRARLTRVADTQAALSKASEDLRDTIVRALSHEFRTPLALIVGYADLMEADASAPSEEEFHEFLQGLRSGVERLNDLVEDFLLLSKLETGALKETYRHLPARLKDPDQIVERVADEFADRAQSRNVSLTVKTKAPVTTVACHQPSLMEITRRLVSNAIKFSKQDGGEVRLTTWQDQESWILQVSDDGIGIRREAINWVFDAFRQVDRDYLEQQGAGLGLAITRGLTDMYGGQIAVESEPGLGSTFTVWLPLRAG